MSKTLRKDFGLNVQALRHAKGMSQEAFADHCGFARSYMSRIERGIANPSLDAIETLATGLGVEPADLFEKHKPVKPHKTQVPFAKDGSFFNPSVIQSKNETYWVGTKTDYKKFKRFKDALRYLEKMKPTAQWWRPNAKGDWGVVSAVRWGDLPD